MRDTLCAQVKGVNFSFDLIVYWSFDFIIILFQAVSSQIEEKAPKICLSKMGLTETGKQ